jgi:hypothetical protein
MQFSWILFVKQIFNDCGFSDLWETEHFNNISWWPVLLLETGVPEENQTAASH